ncbi:hypothetical protein JYU34_020075 [Plutella xylostella]|uniref:Uncharacterized protein n=2 Tax=Plutella xylostella TaxID=51655 RepID=A0ABQ7PWJ3_PLUXY|nr:hypothetical protein JYU34_020075 [Plutella xylostella]CAG9133777.1 unnamed protein product [Plutella xylostella]
MTPRARSAALLSLLLLVIICCYGYKRKYLVCKSPEPCKPPQFLRLEDERLTRQLLDNYKPPPLPKIYF